MLVIVKELNHIRVRVRCDNCGKESIITRKHFDKTERAKQKHCNSCKRIHDFAWSNT